MNFSFQHNVKHQHQNTVLVDPRDVIKVLKMTHIRSIKHHFIYATGKLCDYVATSPF